MCKITRWISEKATRNHIINCFPPKQVRLPPDKYHPTFPWSWNPPSLNYQNLKKKSFLSTWLYLLPSSILPGPNGTRRFHRAWTAVKQPASPGHGKHPSFLKPLKDDWRPSSQQEAVLRNQHPHFLPHLLFLTHFLNNKQKGGILAFPASLGLPLGPSAVANKNTSCQHVIDDSDGLSPL